MIQIENVETFGWEAAVRGMRNPMNSWDKSDSTFNYGEQKLPVIGPNDLDRMRKLVQAGSSDSKFMRYIHVSLDVTAPLYWWKEYDTYKVGTVANSCSTMHRIQSKVFTLDDFSHEHLLPSSVRCLVSVIHLLNVYRNFYNAYDTWVNDDFEKPPKKEVWWQMIQMLPSSYNQRRTLDLNYAVLRAMYHDRKNHKQDEWRNFCKWIETLPYSELITAERGKR